MNRLGLLLAGGLFALTGCLSDPTTRAQLGPDDPEKPLVRTVGDVSEIQTTGAIPVSGIGLVVGLEGTGGGTPPGVYRQLAEEYLKKNKIDNPKEWLESTSNALVLVSGEIAAGSRRGDRINIEITLPPGSKAKSLRGGYLLETSLTSYSSQSQVRNFLKDNTDVRPTGTGDGPLKGHVLADAKGPLSVVLKDKENAVKDGDEGLEAGVKRAWVWRGGRTKADQPYYLVLNPSEQRYRMAITVAERINTTFHGPGAAEKIAVARNADTVVLTIPPQYRSNPPHFLRVVRMIPVDRIDDAGNYRHKLEEQLLQPESALSAGLRLEALGRDSIKALKAAIDPKGVDSPYPLVRFAAAESLAYLGEPIAAAELAKLTEEHPALQAFCLSALSSLDEGASSIALQELLSSEIPEVRYGAFRALRELDPSADASRGIRLNESFWLHNVGSSKSKPMVHLSSNMRSEIVLFGAPPMLRAPFSLRAGPDIVLTAKAGEGGCTISRFSAYKPQRSEQCTLAVADIVKTMGEMGALYEDVASFLLQARDTKTLNCLLALDAIPKAVPINKLGENAHVDKNLENETELLKAPERTPINVFDRESR